MTLLIMSIFTKKFLLIIVSIIVKSIKCELSNKKSENNDNSKPKRKEGNPICFG